jgi:ADP-ribose pyrophosphatase YjhB (NUDIX family)
MTTEDPPWLAIGRELQAIAQTGLTFSRDDYDLQRFQRIRELAAALIAEGSGNEARIILDLFERDGGYATPKVDVRGAVFSEGKILLVQEATDGGWTMPGGWADISDTPSQAVEREILEESGFHARALKLIAVDDYRAAKHPRRHPYSIYKLFFLCEIVGGEARGSAETTAVGFFERDALPPLSLGRTLPAQIERAYRHLERPERPTEFD